VQLAFFSRRLGLPAMCFPRYFAVKSSARGRLGPSARVRPLLPKTISAAEDAQFSFLARQRLSRRRCGFQCFLKPIRYGAVHRSLHGFVPIFVQARRDFRSEEHTSELQSRENLVCRLLLEKKKKKKKNKQ